jgi:inorganic pyrophosphatase
LPQDLVTYQNKKVEIITAIVETPRGQGLKYDYDPLLGCIKLKKIMPSGLVFPFDFGYIPATIGGDGDPVDVLIISEVSTFPGCAVDCRIIGGIKANQQERDGSVMRNDRIIAVPEVSLQYSAVNQLTDLPKALIDQIETFFQNYNQQAGKVFEALKRLSPQQAFTIVEESRTEAQKDTLVQLYIPLSDDKGEPFPQHYYTKLNTELKAKFGGLTVYDRSPATGLWKDDQGTVKDQMLIYEVLTSSIDGNYWKEIKKRLEKQFAQKELMVLITKTCKL